MPYPITESDARKLAEILRREQEVIAKACFNESVECVIRGFMIWKDSEQKHKGHHDFFKYLFGDTIHEKEFIFSLDLEGEIDTGGIAVLIDHKSGKYKLMSQGP